jgi:hypothetical protein
MKDLHVSPTLGCTGDWNLRIETRLMDERFASVMVECEIVAKGAPSERNQSIY